METRAMQTLRDAKNNIIHTAPDIRKFLDNHPVKKLHARILFETGKATIFDVVEPDPLPVTPEMALLNNATNEEILAEYLRRGLKE